MNEAKIARRVAASVLLAKVEAGSTADYFVKEILPHFRKDLAAAVRKFKPAKLRGRGSVDKNTGVVEFILDIPNPYGGGGTIPLVLRASGGYITDDDGEYFLSVSTAGHGDHTYHEKMLMKNPDRTSKVIAKDMEELIEDYIGIVQENAERRK